MVSALLVMGLGLVDESSRDALKQLEGDWWGSGWQGATDKRLNFESNERAELRAGGDAVLISGKHWTLDSNGKEDKVIYDAVGLIWFEKASGKYYLQNHIAGAEVQKFELSIVPHGFQWKIGTNVVVELLIVNGEWVERAYQGEVSDANQFFEIKMKKKSGKS